MTQINLNLDRILYEIYGSIVLACLNSPLLNEEFIIDIFQEFAPTFSFVKRLENVPEFKTLDENRSLKNLVFTN